ncbi:MAG: tyrosine-type recombinase/integrase [Gammaproteobacteria bacterium]|nr:tyrosine-type recombinase/integrase [Gammaproteobacteria bacterium]
MGRKRTAAKGLRKIGDVWHIEKRINGQRLRCSCKTSSLKEAEAILAVKVAEFLNRQRNGAIGKRSFNGAAARYIDEAEKRSIDRDIQDLKLVMPYIGHLELAAVHAGTIQPFIDARRGEGVKSATVNRTLAVVRLVLNRAARLWRDESDQPWLATVPMIPKVDWHDRRDPYPLSSAEQRLLFPQLPLHLAEMALFAVHTGLREQEICRLQWNWEQRIAELDASVFVLPAELTKNGEPRVVVLNDIAGSVIKAHRGHHDTYVFTFKGRPMTRIYNSGWKRARRDAAAKYEEEFGQPCPPGFANLRVHDLRHTFGRRLRAHGVADRTMKALMGHKTNDITLHYAAAEIGALIEAVQMLCGSGARKMPEVTILKATQMAVSR